FSRSRRCAASAPAQSWPSPTSACAASSASAIRFSSRRKRRWSTSRSRRSASWTDSMDAKQSPLFEPVLWEGEGFKILDETLLPWRTEYIEVRALPQALAAVKDMKTRAFGQVLTFFYAAALVARGESSGAALRARMARLGEEFAEARPTFD